MQTDGGVGGARAARHETHARPASQLALGFGHESRAAFLPVGDEADTLGVGVKAIEHGEVTFTGDTEGVGHALGNQAFNEQMAGYAGHGLTLLTKWGIIPA
ncbi:hypothetical protein D9M69_684660 [compost metagenome]